MSKKRLINCEFLNASSFKVKLSNKAKLLYLFMFANADDKGFVDTANEIIQSLEENDKTFEPNINMSLLGNDYKCALDQLVENGLLYEFVDNHHNHIYLIRHWYLHNKMLKGLWTNYGAFYKQVEVIENEYVKRKETKENNNINKEVKLNEIKLSEDKLRYGKVIDQDQRLTDAELNNENDNDLTNSIFGNEDDDTDKLPFDL